MNQIKRIIFLVGVSIVFIHFSVSGQQNNLPVQKEKSPYIDPLLHKVQQGSSGLPRPSFRLFDSGLNHPLDYTKYGEFIGVGTPGYRYIIRKKNGLKKDIGAGIYPNEEGILVDPTYKKLERLGLLEGLHWDYVNLDDDERAFYVWTQAVEDGGVKAFFTALILERAGHLIPAIKAYYAALAHFPRSACWSIDHSFVWYIAPASISSIERLCRDYPSLNLELVGATVNIRNGKDTDLSNDIITVNPGRLIQKTLTQKLGDLPDVNSLKIVETRGEGPVQVVKFSNEHWQLRVDGKPFFIRGVTYNPTEIGIGPHDDPNFHDRWMFSDKNKNGRIDAPYDTWVDKNGNGIQDEDEPAVGDFQLLKEMGVNTIRYYAPNEPKTTYNAALINKPVLRDMFETYGIRAIVGDYFGAYTIGTDATWEQGVDYRDPEQRKTMKESVRAKVMDLKDEPFVLMWLLGNENNLPADYSGYNATRTNASVYPKAYAEFINEVAKMIHEIDGKHPVALGNVELGLFEYYKVYAPEVDILAINSYRSQGFGDLWGNVQEIFDRPVLITEYGCDAYYQDKGIDEDMQLRYHTGNFRDVVSNMAGGPYVGNSIGGVIFEYLDEWWKDSFGNPEDKHQTASQFPFPFEDGFSHEEWYGVVSQGSGQNSPFERRLRKAYYYYRGMNVNQ